MVEAFFAKKMCQLVFPFPVTEGFELKLISDSVKITDFEDFKSSVYSREGQFPTPEKSIEEIYIIDWNEPSYIKFANMAEEVLKSDYYTLNKKQIKGYKTSYTGITKVIKALSKCDILYGPYLKLLENNNLKWEFLENQRRIRNTAYQIEQEHSHELTSEKEINAIIDRIKNALEK